MGVFMQDFAMYFVFIITGGAINMKISYNRLWKLLIDKNMKKQDLKKATGISATCIAKIGRGDNITTDVLVRICTALNCNLEDIMELVPDEASQKA